MTDAKEFASNSAEPQPSCNTCFGGLACTMRCLLLLVLRSLLHRFRLSVLAFPFIRYTIAIAHMHKSARPPITPPTIIPILVVVEELAERSDVVDDEGAIPSWVEDCDVSVDVTRVLCSGDEDTENAVDSNVVGEGRREEMVSTRSVVGLTIK